MYQKIMVPTEGTGFDREAIKVALRLAEKSSAEIHLIRALPASPLIAAGGTDGIELAADSYTMSRDRELSALNLLAAECRESTSVTIVTALEDGPIAAVLEAYAARMSPDLIVITSHARRGITRLTLGSVTDALIRNAHIPVLVVKPERSYLNPRAAERLKLMIIPLDGSTLAEQVLEPAMELAKLEQTEVVLLQVVREQTDRAGDVWRSWWQTDLSVANAYLSRIALMLRRSGVAVSTDIVVGANVAESISSFARSRRAQVVAIATHGRNGIQRAIRGSVADELTRDAEMSLLVLHPALETVETECSHAQRIPADV